MSFPRSSKPVTMPINTENADHLGIAPVTPHGKNSSKKNAIAHKNTMKRRTLLANALAFVCLPPFLKRKCPYRIVEHNPILNEITYHFYDGEKFVGSYAPSFQTFCTSITNASKHSITQKISKLVPLKDYSVTTVPTPFDDTVVVKSNDQTIASLYATVLFLQVPYQLTATQAANKLFQIRKVLS